MVSVGVVGVVGVIGVATVSVLPAVSTGVVAVESTLRLSDVPDTFFVELHAEIAIVNVPATIRLKINFFMVSVLNSII